MPLESNGGRPPTAEQGTADALRSLCVAGVPLQLGSRPTSSGSAGGGNGAELEMSITTAQRRMAAIRAWLAPPLPPAGGGDRHQATVTTSRGPAASALPCVIPASPPQQHQSSSTMAVARKSVPSSSSSPAAATAASGGGGLAASTAIKKKQQRLRKVKGGARPSRLAREPAPYILRCTYMGITKVLYEDGRVEETGVGVGSSDLDGEPQTAAAVSTTAVPAHPLLVASPSTHCAKSSDVDVAPTAVTSIMSSAHSRVGESRDREGGSAAAPVPAAVQPLSPAYDSPQHSRDSAALPSPTSHRSRTLPQLQRGQDTFLTSPGDLSSAPKRSDGISERHDHFHDEHGRVEGGDAMVVSPAHHHQSHSSHASDSKCSDSRISTAAGSGSDDERGADQPLRRPIRANAPSLFSIQLPPMLACPISTYSTESTAAGEATAKASRSVGDDDHHHVSEGAVAGAAGVPPLLPGGLHVSTLFTLLVAREHGALHGALSGLDITRFMQRSVEASQFIIVFVWFIVVRCRRTWLERLIIGRYRAMALAFRELFPRSGAKGAPPPMHVLETIRNELVESMAEWEAMEHEHPEHHDGKSAAAEKGAGGANAALTTSPSPGSGSSKGAAPPTAIHFLREHGFMALLALEDIVKDNAMPQGRAVKDFTAALALFRDARDEYNGLVDAEHECFSRLARLFGHIFSTLGTQKDVVLRSYHLLVTRVTNYSLLFTFTNDAHAGLFNTNFRADMVRLLQYWFSGLIVTHVPVKGWPTPTSADFAEAARARRRELAAKEEALITGHGAEYIDSTVSPVRSLSGSVSPLERTGPQALTGNVTDAVGTIVRKSTVGGAPSNIGHSRRRSVSQLVSSGPIQLSMTTLPASTRRRDSSTTHGKLTTPSSTFMVIMAVTAEPSGTPGAPPLGDADAASRVNAAGCSEQSAFPPHCKSVRGCGGGTPRSAARVSIAPCEEGISAATSPTALGGDTLMPPLPSSQLRRASCVFPGPHKGLLQSATAAPSTRSSMTRAHLVSSSSPTATAAHQRPNSLFSGPMSLASLSEAFAGEGARRGDHNSACDDSDNDDDFDNVDAGVVNGEYRLISDFTRYTRHVGLLLSDLGKRLNHQHRQQHRKNQIALRMSENQNRELGNGGVGGLLVAGEELGRGHPDPGTAAPTPIQGTAASPTSKWGCRVVDTGKEKTRFPAQTPTRMHLSSLTQSAMRRSSTASSAMSATSPNWSLSRPSRAIDSSRKYNQRRKGGDQGHNGDDNSSSNGRGVAVTKIGTTRSQAGGRLQRDRQQTHAHSPPADLSTTQAPLSPVSKAALSRRKSLNMSGLSVTSHGTGKSGVLFTGDASIATGETHMAHHSNSYQPGNSRRGLGVGRTSKAQDNIFENMKRMELRRSRFHTTSQTEAGGTDLVAFAAAEKQQRLCQAAGPTTTTTATASPHGSRNAKGGGGKAPASFGVGANSGQICRLDASAILGIGEHASLLTTFPLVTCDAVDRAYLLCYAGLRLSEVPIPPTNSHAAMAAKLTSEQRQLWRLSQQQQQRGGAGVATTTTAIPPAGASASASLVSLSPMWHQSTSSKAPPDENLAGTLAALASSSLSSSRQRVAGAETGLSALSGAAASATASAGRSSQPLRAVLPTNSPFMSFFAIDSAAAATSSLPPPHQEPQQKWSAVTRKQTELPEISWKPIRGPSSMSSTLAGANSQLPALPSAQLPQAPYSREAQQRGPASPPPTLLELGSSRAHPRGFKHIAAKRTQLLVVPPEDTLSRPLVFGALRREAARRQEKLAAEVEIIAARDALSRRQYLNDQLHSSCVIRATQSSQAEGKFQRRAREALELRLAQAKQKSRVVASSRAEPTASGGGDHRVAGHREGSSDNDDGDGTELIRLVTAMGRASGSTCASDFDENDAAFGQALGPSSLYEIS